MNENQLSQPDLVGRDPELAKLKQALVDAIAGKGSTVFIAGEAGIGKTRLVSELINDAEKKGAQIIRGWCLAESLEPLMPVKLALREAGLFHLISGDPPPLLLSAYLMNDAGLLIAKAEREELGLDPYIFSSMLKAVGSFVQDSMRMMDNVERTGGLNSLGYKEYKILIEELNGLYLACVTKGALSEMLVNDMKSLLKEFLTKFSEVLNAWNGEISKVKDIETAVSIWMICGKYNGKFLVDDPKLKQENLFDNVLMGLQRASKEKPLILFIDDLQWADPTTLNLLHYLSRNTRKDKLLILGTYRPEDIMLGFDGKAHQLETAMQKMNREDLFILLDLKRLDKTDTESLVNNVLAISHFEPAFFEKIHKETEGTPFFVLEVIKLLAEESVITRDNAGAWTLMKDLDKLDLPSKVYDVIKRRLDRLMKEHRKVLECSSVVGEEFHSEVVGKVMGQNKLQLLENLSEIEKTHKLLHYFKDKYKFDHSKIREVLYNSVGEELRREYHRLIADTIAEIHKDNPNQIVNELAYHYFEARDVKAGKFLLKAGDSAGEKSANEEALRFYRNALEFFVDEEKVNVLEKLGDIQVRMGKYDNAIENFLRASKSTANKETKVRMLRKAGDSHEKKGEYDNAIEVLSEAKSLAEAGTIEYGRVMGCEGNTYWKKGNYDNALHCFLEAVMTSEKVGADKKDIGNALRAVGIFHSSKGELVHALQYYEKSLSVMDEIEDQYGIAAALNNIGSVHYERGELDRALEFYRRGYDIFEKIGDKQGIAGTLNNIGSAHSEKGEPERALEFYGRSLKIREKIGDRWGFAMLLNNIGSVHFESGELDRALEFYEHSLKIREKIESRQGVALSLNNIGEVYLYKGELGKALELYEHSLEISLEIGEKRLYIHNLCGLAEVKLGKGDAQAALEHAKESAEVAAEIGAKPEEGLSHRVLGMIYREMKKWDIASDEFTKARAILEEVGDKVRLSRVFYEYALLSKFEGAPTQAKEHLFKALTEFERMGMKLWADKCRKALEELEQ
jgi:tetratricopeptide (TPR) repeat protein